MIVTESSVPGGQPGFVEGVGVPSVAAGSRLLLYASTGAIPLRSLAEVTIAGSWRVAVLGPAAAVTAGEGIAELPTDQGLLRVPARIRLVDGVLTLSPVATAPTVLQQRRRDVRAEVELAVRAADLEGLRANRASAAVVEGKTFSLSAGGFCAYVTCAGTPPGAGQLMYAELELPDGAPVRSTVTVLELRVGCLRAAFTDISRADRERLVRLVSARQREDLALRRRRGD